MNFTNPGLDGCCRTIQQSLFSSVLRFLPSWCLFSVNFPQAFLFIRVGCLLMPHTCFVSPAVLFCRMFFFSYLGSLRCSPYGLNIDFQMEGTGVFWPPGLLLCGCSFSQPRALPNLFIAQWEPLQPQLRGCWADRAKKSGRTAMSGGGVGALQTQCTVMNRLHRFEWNDGTNTITYFIILIIYYSFFCSSVVQFTTTAPPLSLSLSFPLPPSLPPSFF